MRMYIVADENIPFVDTLFGPLGDITKKPGREITNIDLRNADVLIVRSVTPVNAALLDNTQVKFVGTCTIGTDHLDTRYLSQRGIHWSSAPGCNANAVVQYVLSALAHFDALYHDTRALIIGGGNVGSRVYRALSALGLDCFCVDPFLDKNSALRLVDFKEIYRADIICLHTPLTRSGLHPTERLVNQKVLANLKPNAILINAGRGEVVDNTALEAHMRQRPMLRVALDVWSNEPNISVPLMDRVDLATPHIAGYSLEGRVNGALMIFASLCKFLEVAPAEMDDIAEQVHQVIFSQTESLRCDTLRDCLLKVYDVGTDDRALREGQMRDVSSFDSIRKHYPMRREYSFYRCEQVAVEDRKTYRAIGFLVDE